MDFDPNADQRETRHALSSIATLGNNKQSVKPSGAKHFTPDNDTRETKQALSSIITSSVTNTTATRSKR